MFCLVGDYAISENFIIAKRVLIDAAAVAGVALDGVDNTVFDLLDDTDMIGLAVLRTGAAPVIPIEKDNVAWARLIAVVLPQSPLLEPRHTLRCTGRKLRNDASFNIDRNHTEGRHTVNKHHGAAWI